MTAELVRTNTKRFKRIHGIAKDLARVLAKHKPMPHETTAALGDLISMLFEADVMDGDVDAFMASLNEVVRANMELDSAEGEA